MNIQFGSGVLFGKPIAGNQPTNPTPFRFGVLQEVMVDFKADLKKLFGQGQFPVATARGKVNVEIKGKLAVFDPAMLNQLYFAQTSAAGISQIADQESHTVPSTPFTVTVTNAATYLEDYGVQYSSGQQLIAVASGPTVGQYSVNTSTGVYTFAAADTGNTVLISYLWNNAARGTTVTVVQQLMGYAPELAMLLYNSFRAKYLSIELFDVTLGEISIPSKLEDFWIADFTGSANANATNTVMKLYLDNV
jgi:hypothetical protein